MLGYDYIANTMRGYGVTHIFYIEAMFRIAMREMEAMGIKGIMAHSENGAGYMADGYARATGKPGICMAQSIGSANLAGGIQDAWLANSPVIAITGKKSSQYQYRNCYQEADHRLIYEGITKFNADASDPDQLPMLLRQCFREVTTGKPRPAHIDVTNQMGRIAELANIKEPLSIEETYKEYPAFRPAASGEAVVAAAKAIDEAEKPIIVAGRGATISGASAEICALAKKADIPVVTSPDGKTIIDENDELWSGIVGNYGMDCANRSVMDADLVIFIGTQAADQTTLDWSVPKPEVKVVHIDIEASELGKNYPNTIGLLGDAKVVSGQLAEKVTARKRPEWRAHVAAYVKATLDDYEIMKSEDSVPISPARLCAEVSKALPNDAVLVADTGYSAVWSATMIKMKPSQKYFRAAGSLGWAFPASLGAKCGLPERPVVCFTGDGAMYYHLGEMETAARYNIPVVVVINNNQVLAQCSGDLKQVHKNSENKGAHHFSFTDVNLSRVAEELGCYAMRVTKAEEIGTTIEKALASGRPSIVEVMTDKNIIVPPAYCPNK